MTREIWFAFKVFRRIASSAWWCGWYLLILRAVLPVTMAPSRVYYGYFVVLEQNKGDLHTMRNHSRWSCIDLPGRGKVGSPLWPREPADTVLVLSWAMGLAVQMQKLCDGGIQGVSRKTYMLKEALAYSLTWEGRAGLCLGGDLQRGTADLDWECCWEVTENFYEHLNPAITFFVEYTSRQRPINWNKLQSKQKEEKITITV